MRRENAEVKVLLVNGAVLRGIVKGFDNFTVILSNRNGQHLVYKHAIAQLVSMRQGGPRREGEEQSTGEGDQQSEARTTSSPDQAPQNSNDKNDNAKQKKDGFNKLDLSHVKI